MTLIEQYQDPLSPIHVGIKTALRRNLFHLLCRTTYNWCKRPRHRSPVWLSLSAVHLLKTLQFVVFLSRSVGNALIHSLVISYSSRYKQANLSIWSNRAIGQWLDRKALQTLGATELTRQVRSMDINSLSQPQNLILQKKALQ